MGLRCLLGHDFGEPETERERTEEGNEVVVTVREVKTCQRCGEKQVVSENKEITSIEQLRESATGDSTPPAGASTTPEPSPTADSGTAEEWGTDELSPGGDTGASEPTPGVDEGMTADAEPAEKSTAVSDADEDPVERGVADIIEQAERDDDMLEGPSEPTEADEATDDGDDVPVHPGQRSAAAEESEIPDAEEDDGVILDEDDTEPPETARKQWEEEASPEEVPDQDPIVEADAAADEEYDAEIIDAESDPSDADPADSTDRSQAADPGEPTESAASDPGESSTPAAVESEDAEIVDADQGPADPEPETPSEPEREETDEGHMPWPDAPGEDEGHDATVPDGEPADIDFGEGFTSTDDGADATESATVDPEPVETESHTEPDRDNGDRTPTGESSDASSAPTANVDLERSSRDAELEYYCPECGLTRDVGNSSMRAGDICPECRVGYITEQQKAE